MTEFVVDTNVPLIAKGASHMSRNCEENCALFIERFLKGRQTLVIDDAYAILDEYMNQLKTNGPANYASIFLKWLFQHQANPHKVKKIEINRIGDNAFKEIPDSLMNFGIDPSDMKFIAVAIAYNGKAKIAEASDSKWIGWVEELRKHKIKIHFTCMDELAAIHKRKIG